VADERMCPIDAGMDREEVVRLLELAGGKPTEPIRERAENAGVPAVEAIRIGVPHEVIRRYAAEHGVDLVVMGTHGRTGLDHALLGSVTERVVRTADVPVMTVPLDRR
jgi:nucleotide-binding universal stress UspA family protein